MKKIAYIEIDTHAEIAADFMDLMKDSQEFSVDYYFSAKIRNQIAKDAENIHVSDSSMILDQLKSEKYDTVIIGTVHRYFNTFLAISQKYNTSVVVHNLNFSKVSKADLLKAVFKNELLYRIKLWWKEGLFYSSKVYRKSKNLLVLDRELSSEKYKFLPLFHTKLFENKENKVLSIIIPGGVSQKRRDYDGVIRKIKEIETEIKTGSEIKTKLIEFVFLGKAKGCELKKITDLERSLKYVSIKYFSERVSTQLFDDWMKKTDVLWCPIQEETEFFSRKEIYGKTKMTGNLGDAIKYGKPAVFPRNYVSNLEFIYPEEENLIAQFEKLKNSSYDFQKKFSREKIQGNLEQLLNELSSI